MNLLCLLLCSQIVANGGTAFLSWLWLFSFIVQMVGIFVEGKEILRVIGLAVGSFLAWVAIWCVVGNSWCSLFYFSKFFSSDYYD